NACATAPVEWMAVSSVWNSSVEASPQRRVSPIRARATVQLACWFEAPNVTAPADDQLHPEPVCVHSPAFSSRQAAPTPGPAGNPVAAFWSGSTYTRKKLGAPA